jgi:hypothetical protein
MMPSDGGTLMRTKSWITAIVASLLVWSPPAEAQPDTSACAGPRWIAVRIDVPSWTQVFSQQVLAQLSAGLAPDEIDVCASPATSHTPALAEIAISGGEPFLIETVDTATRYRLARALDLRLVPPDGRALAVALVADSLLRASWVRVAEAVPPSRAVGPTRFALSAGAALESYAGGQVQWGGDLGVHVSPSRELARLGVFVRVGGRVGRPALVDGGVVRSTAFVASAGVTARLELSSRLRLEPALGLFGALLRYDASPDPGFTARAISGGALYARAQLAMSFASSARWHAFASGGIGTPLVAYAASADGRNQIGATGLELSGSLGVLFAY